MTKLGRLEKVTDITTIWKDEARDFTPWLAREDNLALLSETLGFGDDGLELEGVETSVGPFRADILCRDANSAEGERVLIENQYGRTDHDHIGKLITYSAGLGARSVVLICEQLRPEHRAALDWLNDISADDHRFFGVTVELWRIGDSLPAPRFNVVVAPNDWVRQVKSKSDKTTTETQAFYERYWQAMADRIDTTDTPLRARKAPPQSWTGFGIGRSNFELNASIVGPERSLRAELTLYSDASKAWLSLLQQDQAEIEKELGFGLKWDFMPGRKGARAFVSTASFNVSDEASWLQQHDWLIRHLSAMHNVFHGRIRSLDAADWEGEV